MRPQFTLRPLYLQVYDKLTSLIADGTWAAGTMIANEVDLARDLGVSVGTARKALQLMVERRLLKRQQGRGTFVADHQASSVSIFDNLLDRSSGPMQWSISVENVTIAAADDTERASLGLRSGRDVIRRRRKLHDPASGTLMLETSILPRDQFAKLSSDDEAHAWPVGRLAKAYGLILGSSEEFVTLQQADGRDAKDLGVASGTPLLNLARTVYSLDEQPLEWRKAICKPGPETHYCNRIG
jgi:GntR family transcriptional regulator